MKKWTAERKTNDSRGELQFKYDGLTIIPRTLVDILNDYENESEGYSLMIGKVERLEAEKLALMAEKSEVEKHLDCVIEDKKALESEVERLKDGSQYRLLRSAADYYWETLKSTRKSLAELKRRIIKAKGILKGETGKFEWLWSDIGDMPDHFLQIKQAMDVLDGGGE
jgi:uncharacterized protein (UPF0335 family)